MPTRFATVALAGRPNVGKSTLLNRIVGEKLAITSSKPQSTRFAVSGIWTEGSTQLLFMDLPGLFEPTNLLQDSMVEAAKAAMADADLVLFLHPVTEKTLECPPQVAQLSDSEASRLATVLTKADLIPSSDRPLVRSPSFFVSALTGEGVPELLEWCRSRAPAGSFRYDPKDLSTQDLRFFATELVREATFELLEQELPYAVAPVVDEFREASGPVYIRMILYVERNSHKGMLIGRNGQMIRALGQRARSKIETLLGEQVYLELWVKVLLKWRTRPGALRMLGLPLGPKSEGK
ncbi:MAG: GTPase Era [Gemmatimonadota bacterium]|nr:MAG: GTPase Era [Gemmatimonadota bacterium]